MRITRLHLKNVKAILVALNKHEIEIDLSKSLNRIINIMGKNGTGKTIILSSLTPFATLTSLDERSSLGYIIKGKTGLKEIHYNMNGNEYIISHIFKPVNDKHTTKSYIMKNGKELNQNGNVTSFLELIELEFGITPEMMRLIRLGSNVDSFISLQPSKRKEYFGNMIPEVEEYLIMNKKLMSDIRVTKSLMNNNSYKYHKLNINDINKERTKLNDCHKKLKKLNSKRDSLVGEISILENLKNQYSLEKLISDRYQLMETLKEYDTIQKKYKNLSKDTIDKIDLLLDEIKSEHNKISTNIHTLNANIDSTFSTIKRLKGILSTSKNNDIEDLRDSIKKLNSSLSEYKFKTTIDYTSQDISSVIKIVEFINSSAININSNSDISLKLFYDLYTDKKSISKFIVDKSIILSSQTHKDTLERILFISSGNKSISPNCNNGEYKKCPYYKTHDTIAEILDGEDSKLKLEHLEELKIIDSTFSNILNAIDTIKEFNIPDEIRSAVSSLKILENIIKKKSPITIDIYKYLTNARSYEAYMYDFNRLQSMKEKLKVYESNKVVENIQQELHEYELSLKALNSNKEKEMKNLSIIDKRMSETTTIKETIDKYNQTSILKNSIEEQINSLNDKIDPIKDADKSLVGKRIELDDMNNQILNINDKIAYHVDRIKQHDMLLEEYKVLKDDYKKQDILVKSTGSKTGIPLIFMKSYQNEILNKSNSLLSHIYSDNEGITLLPFDVTTDSFSIPYIRNGIEVEDIRFSSQSELPLSTMALSFAMSSGMCSQYNVLLLDEVDSGLDEKNKLSFLKMLDNQMTDIMAEQVFVISHNMSSMANVPMDIIQLSNTEVDISSYNVIWSNV